MEKVNEQRLYMSNLWSRTSIALAAEKEHELKGVERDSGWKVTGLEKRFAPHFVWFRFVVTWPKKQWPRQNAAFCAASTLLLIVGLWCQDV